jgi:hypothetical protein
MRCKKNEATTDDTTLLHFSEDGKTESADIPNGGGNSVKACGHRHSNDERDKCCRGESVTAATGRADLRRSCSGDHARTEWLPNC